RAVWAGLSFFFQAEDGIRDGHVTGVQACALPISRRTPSWRDTWPAPAGGRRSGSGSGADCGRCWANWRSSSTVKKTGTQARADEIGRASCRERVEGAGGGGAGKRKVSRGRVGRGR